MNNRLYEYMRLGKEEDEKQYKEELFDTKKIIKLSDADIKAYNEAHSKELAKEKKDNANEADKDMVNQNQDSYYNNYRHEESRKSEPSVNSHVKKNSESGSDGYFYHYRSPFSRNKATENARDNESKDYNTTDCSTLLMGLMGKDDEYKLLPWIHREIAYVNESNYSYNAFDIIRDNLDKAVDGGLALGIKGFNVSSQYKEEIIPRLKAIGKSAYLIGAVDTLVYKEDGYYGFNTGMAAVKKCLQNDGISLNDRNVLVAGNSDFVANIIVACADLKARNVLLLTDNGEKYDKVINRVMSSYDETSIKVITAEDDILYELNQLTTIRNFKWICFNSDYAFPEVEDLYERIEAGYDCSYEKPVTGFTEGLNKAGAVAENGLKLFIYQAVASYELWTGKKVIEGTVDYIYKKLSKKLYK